MDEVSDWASERWSAAAEGLTCATARAHCTATASQAYRLEGDARQRMRQYEIFSGDRQKPDPTGRDRMPQLAGALELLGLLTDKIVAGRVIDVASDIVETAEMSPR